MMSLWDALRMNMMISYQELVRTFPNTLLTLSSTPDIFPNLIVYEKRFNADKLILYG